VSVTAEPRRLERADVMGVDVSVSRGRFEGSTETYLFVWDGTQWKDATPEAVGVTVTSAVP
jgi:hypothetical protein